MIDFDATQATRLNLFALEQWSAHLAECPVCPFRTNPCIEGQQLVDLARKWDTIGESLYQNNIAEEDQRYYVICHHCHCCYPQDQCLLLGVNRCGRRDPVYVCIKCDDQEWQNAGFR